MNNPIRVKYFFWLAGLLLSFLVIKSLSLLVINWHQILGRGPDWKEEFYEWIFITGVGVVLLPVLLLAAWRISKTMLLPLREIIMTANRIYGGHLNERVSVSATHDEIAELAEGINRALDRYEEAVARQRQFAGTASHQLRTPLTAIRSVGEIALHKERNPEEYREAIGAMLEESDRLSHIVEQLLILAKMNVDEIQKTFMPVDVCALLLRIKEQFAPLSEAKEIVVEIGCDPDISVDGHAELLEQVVGNVQDNAIRHTPPGGKICLVARRTDQNKVEISVSDTGPGFTPRQMQWSDKATPDNSGDISGPGLGLKIAADIVRAHKGRLKLGASEQSGAQVAILLPTART